MTKLQYLLLPKHKRLLYDIKFAQKHKLKIDLMNGVVLDFSDNTIKTGVNYQKLSNEQKLHEWRW